MSKEAMKRLTRDDTEHGVEYYRADEVDALLAEQPEQQEPVDFASLLREAEEIVREKPTWKRFIDGTPLANDIAVWMTVFAQDVARRAFPPAQPSKPLKDEEIVTLFNKTFNGKPLDVNSMTNFARAIEAAHGIKGDA